MVYEMYGYLTDNKNTNIERRTTMNETNNAASGKTNDEIVNEIIEYLRKEHITIGRSKKVMEMVICKIREIENTISL